MTGEESECASEKQRMIKLRTDMLDIIHKKMLMDELNIDQFKQVMASGVDWIFENVLEGS